MYQLYYYPNNASLAPHFLLHHMQLDFQLLLVDRHTNEQKSAQYLKLNPAGRIPTLLDNGQAIFESAAICIYLCEQHPEYQLIPLLGNQQRPLFFQWLMYLTNTLQAELMVRYYPDRHTNNEKTTANIVAAQEERIAECFTVLDKQLADNQYLLGDTLSGCDFFLFMLAEWSLSLRCSPLNFKHLGLYLKKLATHATIKAVCEQEEIDLCPFMK